MENRLNISIEMVQDLKIKPRNENEILGICPVCGCKDANFNTAKFVWRCWHCFLPDTDVYCIDGIKTIDSISIGDKVLADGKFSIVENVHKLSYTGGITVIDSKNFAEPIRSTDNHLYFRLVNSMRDATRVNWKKQKDFYIEEVAASKVRVGDYLIYPVNKSYTDKHDIATVNYVGGKLLPKSIAITPEFLRICGLYIAEGSTYRGGVQFSFSSKEETLAIDVENYFRSLGLSTSRANNYKSTQLVIKISNTHLQKTFDYWFGKGCNNKSIPKELLNLPPHKIVHLLNGVVDGDGYTSGGRIIIEQTSKKLAYQLLQICSGLGGSYMSSRCRIGKKKTYTVHLSINSYPQHDYNLRYNTWFNIVKVSNVSNYFVNNIDVYDLTTDCGKYNVNGILVHNCPSSGAILVDGVYQVQEEEQEVFDIPKIRSLYTSLADKFTKSMFSEVVDYLKSRGLTEETIHKFRLGFCSTDFYDEYADDVAEDSGVIYKSYPVLSNRVIIPYIVGDEVTDLRGRVLDSLFKYKNGTPTYTSLMGSHDSRGAVYLFNHDIIEKEGTIIITEGEFKALLAIQHGFPVVATPGVFGWNKSWGPLFKDKEVILAADHDNISGTRSPAYLMTRNLLKYIPQLKVATLYKSSTEKKVDIDFMILNRGPKSFQNAVEGALPADRWLRLEEKKGHGRRR